MPRRVIVELEDSRIGTGTLRNLVRERVVRGLGEGGSFPSGAEVVFSNLENLQRTFGDVVQRFVDLGEPNVGTNRR